MGSGGSWEGCREKDHSQSTHNHTKIMNNNKNYAELLHTAISSFGPKPLLSSFCKWFHNATTFTHLWRKNTESVGRRTADWPVLWQWCRGCGEKQRVVSSPKPTARAARHWRYWLCSSWSPSNTEACNSDAAHSKIDLTFPCNLLSHIFDTTGA